MGKSKTYPSLVVKRKKPCFSAYPHDGISIGKRLINWFYLLKYDTFVGIKVVMELNMQTKIEIIIQQVNSKNGKVLESIKCEESSIIKPTNLESLGYLHKEQIKILNAIQGFKIKHQTALINQSNSCIKCGGKAIDQGLIKSKFHAALTDHEVLIQRKRCQCGWSSPCSIEGIYGSKLHPDLMEKQAIQGSENSYRHASKNLNYESKTKRSVNNVDRIRKSVTKVANILAFKKLKEPQKVEVSEAAKNLVVVVDGGHVKSNDDESRSFEAMIATVYEPKNVEIIDKNHKKITQKTSVASALSDKQKTIKKLVINACKKEGVHSQKTTLTCLTDGASNCWSITNTLKPYAKKHINILDWFHITKRFTVINNSLNDRLKERLDKIKWHLWHGNSTVALKRISTLLGDVSDKNTAERLTDLSDYITRNKKYLANYQNRQSNNLPFTSTLAESSVNSLINVRQKYNKKMQWSRFGSHTVLQIKTSLFSHTWQDDWEYTKKEIYNMAA